MGLQAIKSIHYKENYLAQAFNPLLEHLPSTFEIQLLTFFF